MKKPFAIVFSVVIAAIIALWTFPKVYATDATGTTATATPTADASSSEAQIDANNQQITALNQQIAQYQAELQQVGANKKTLQAAINALDIQKSKVQAQVGVTKAQLGITQLQIGQLGGEISDTKAAIATQQAALAVELQNLQQSDNKPLIVEILSTGSLIQTWNDVNATLQIQRSIQNQMGALQMEENSLNDAQTATKQKQGTLTSQQQSLASQQKTLAATVQSKNQLLAETSAQESTYQKLLAAAEAELNSFSAFTQNAGGSKLLTNQTVCDAWGCYYNQRDALWGNNALNGTQYTLASDGCLVTAMAMVMTHYGYKDVTPVTINSDPSNFAAYYPAYLLYTINVDGVSATRKTATIDATLASGNPVIVGLNAYGGTHYVVLVSGSNGKYIMRDPYIPNGKDVSFSANYTLRDIFGISKVTIST